MSNVNVNRQDSCMSNSQICAFSLALYKQPKRSQDTHPFGNTLMPYIQCERFKVALILV